MTPARSVSHAFDASWTGRPGRRHSPEIRRALRTLDELAELAGGVLDGLPGAAVAFRRRLADSPAADDMVPAAGTSEHPDDPFAAELARVSTTVLAAGAALDLTGSRADGWTDRAHAALQALARTVRAAVAPSAHEISIRADVLGAHTVVEGEPEWSPRATRNELVAAVDDDLVGVVAGVKPGCVCRPVGAEQQFRAVAAANRRIPQPLPADVRLLVGAADATAHIVSSDTTGITFRLPPGARTGSVVLRRVPPGASSPTPLPPDALAAMFPDAVLVLLDPPEFNTLRIGDSPLDLRGDRLYRVSTNACGPVEIAWAVKDAGSPRTDCGEVRVTVTGNGNRTVGSGPASGAVAVMPADGERFAITATRSAGRSGPCAQRSTVQIELDRVRTIRFALSDPNPGPVLAGSAVRATVTLSCPAPPGGLDVELDPARAADVRLPAEVRVPAGMTSVECLIDVSSTARGSFEIRAKAAGHRSGALTLNVQRRVAMSLSGGGAKGSFQVGALQYFRQRRWDEVEPDIVTATSVGSVNGLALAEAGNDGVDRLLGVWLQLRTESDMFVESQWVVRIKEIVTDLVGDDLGDIAASDILENLLDAGASPGTIIPGILLGGLLPGLPAIVGSGIGGVLGALTGGTADALDKVGELVEQVKGIKYLYSLDPTRQLVLANVRFDRIGQAGGRILRMASVCLEDGAVYYATESGDVISGHAADPDYRGRAVATHWQALLEGAMASAGIPAVFPSVRQQVIGGDGVRVLTLVDGGVREVLPVRAAAELGARLIVSISCQPNLPGRAESFFGGEVIENFNDASLVDVALRAVGLSTHEVNRNEVTPDYGFGDEVDRVFVVPSFEVHRTQEIHPGKILVNLGYGWMRAFENYARHRGAVSALVHQLLIAGSDRITALRQEILGLEETVLRVLDEDGSYRTVGDTTPARPIERYAFDGPVLRRIRELKLEVRDLVVSRVEGFGSESVPLRLDVGSYRNPTAGWWLHWERHRPAVDAALRRFAPWTQLAIRHTLTGNGSVRPVLETGAVTPPAIPTAVSAVLGDQS